MTQRLSMFGALVLVLLAGESPDASALAAPAALCLAPPLLTGATPDERMALEAALVRAIHAARCADAPVVDAGCFDDDDCLRRRAKNRSAGFVATSALLAAGELHLLIATVGETVVSRHAHDEAWLSFLTSGSLPASWAESATSAAQPSTLGTSAPAAAAATASMSLPPALRWLDGPGSSSSNDWAPLAMGYGVGGVVVGGLVSAVGLGLAASSGLDKDVREAGGTIGVVGLVVAGVAALAAVAGGVNVLYAPSSSSSSSS
jgi:hypothetical protein